MPSAGFEPAIITIDRPQTYALDRMTTGIGFGHIGFFNNGLLQKTLHTTNYRPYKILHLLFEGNIVRYIFKRYN
jgi:hypothetical protein